MKLIRTNRRRTNRSRRGGAAILETALVLPVVLMFLFGILEYGRYIMTLQIMTNAAREGARYAQAHTSAITIFNVTAGNATTDVQTKVSNMLAGQALSGQNIQVYASDSLGNNLGTWTNASNGQSICVRITGNYNVLIPTLLRMPATIPVVAQSVVRSEAN